MEQVVRGEAPGGGGKGGVAERLALALEAAREAGARTLRWFRSGGFGVSAKADGSPVTDADREAETMLRRAIQERFPGDGLLGEEFGSEHGTTGYRWILDPIDGTKSFVRGVPLYGVLVGVERDGRCVAGVIHLPALRETVYGGPGLGAWHEPAGREGAREPARVSAESALGSALVCVTAPELMARCAPAGVLDRLAARAGAVRGWSDCYAHVLVATGRVEAVVEPRMSPWDIAATIPIVEAAGGRVTGYDGREGAACPTSVVSNGGVHAALLALVNEG